MDTPVHEYTITQQDFNEAQRLHRRHAPRAAWLYWSLYVALPLLAMVYLLYWFLLWPSHGFLAFMHQLPEGLLALYLALAVPILFWFSKRRAWKNMQPNDRRGKPVTVQFDDTYIISAIPGVSDGRFFWSAIVDYTENETMALLYPRPKLFLLVPKRAMPDDEWQRLRDLALPRQKRKP